MSINEKLSTLDWLIHMLLRGCLKLRAVGGNIPQAGGPGLCSNGEKKFSTSKDIGQHVYINLSLLLTVGMMDLAV